MDRVANRLASIISDGIADGSIRKIDANVGAQMVIALINDADELKYFVRGISPEVATAVYVRPFFTGLLRSADPENLPSSASATLGGSRRAD